ncbi:MAG: hypothetical protein H2060_02385 [Azoarcus sp.]|nr:hypothetical protein [Azoarcus sp.]
MRTILILILLLILYWWARRALADRHRRKPGKRKGTKTGPERMLACEHCGVHIPESEGVQDASGFYCSDEHRRLGVRDR